VSQDRGGEHGLGLGGLELVVLAGGQVSVAGGVNTAIPSDTPRSSSSLTTTRD
jgi:hypothetical protein